MDACCGASRHVPVDLGIRADVADGGGVTAHRINPQPLFDGIGSSARTVSLAVLGEGDRVDGAPSRLLLLHGP